MTNQIYKISIIFSSLVLSLLLASCSQGDRSFVPLPEEPVEEVEADIFISAGAVKGPLINAEINIYKFELNQGPIYHLNNALSTWFTLLDANQVQEAEDGSIALGALTANEVLDNLDKSFSQFGYVTELEALKSDLESETDFSSAEVLVETYIGAEEDGSDALESNTAVRREVKTSLQTSATLSELKSKIGAIETLTEKLLATGTFTEAKSVLNTYSSTEINALKQEGFQRILSDLDSLSLKSKQFGLSQIRSYYETNISDVLLTGFSLQNDPIARLNLTELKSGLDNTSTFTDAHSLIQNAYRKEGNTLARTALAKLLSKIPTIDDFYELVDGDQSIYHDFSIKADLVTAIETIDAPTNADPQQVLKTIINDTTEVFSSRMEIAFRGSLIIEGEDEDDLPLNRLSFGVSNDQGILAGLIIGQYRGFVYMEAISSDRTIDLNTGKVPIFKKMESIFHTDDILGNGDNSQEDVTISFLLNGDLQKDSDGKIITDKDLIESQTSDKLLEVRPSFFATPLTTFAVGLTLEKFKSFDNLRTDSDLDLLPENRITESLLKTSLQSSSKTVSDTFGIGLSEQNIFKSSPVRLAQMQYSQESELQAIQYRLSIENYSSFLYELVELTNLKDTDLLEVLIDDLNDGQVDGFYKDQAIDILSNIPQLQYLLTVHPSERIIPGTNKPVSGVYYLMNNELSTTLPTESINFFPTKNSDVIVIAPMGGLDSDSDGVLDNDDQFPLDENRSRDLNAGYAGIWSVTYDNSETEYMPFNKSLEFQFNLEQIEGSCTTSPCIGLGDILTPISATYDLISAPTNNDFIVTNEGINSVVGFSAFATVPGDYLLKAELTTDIQPKQSYTVFIPIHVINPRSIQIKFDPAEPQPGKSVTTLFKATKGICHLYPICSNIDLTDNVDDYLPLTLLSDIFSIEQKIDRDGTILSYSSVNSSNPNQTSSDLSNIDLKDSLSLSVKFNSGDRSFTSAIYQNVVGNDQDKDSDGVSDVDDFYPLDSLCHLEKDGILDTNFDGDINSLDSPICFATKQNSATKSFDINFLNEKWFYNPEWHYIIRANTNKPGYNGFIKTPTLTGTKELVNFDLNLVDNISKRVYLVYENGAIDYFSFETQSLQDFSPSYSFNPVISMHMLGTYLLVEYASGNVTKLFNRNTQIADIHSDASYPYPGNAISLKIDNQNLSSATNNLLDIEWTLERESTAKDSDGNYIVNQLAILTSDDDLTLNSGQTAFGDVAKISLHFKTVDNRTITVNDNIFVLGIESIIFAEKDHEDDIPLIINLVNFNSDLLPSDHSSIFVKWYKNNIDTDDYIFSLSDKRYPYAFEASNFELGDMIRGDIYIKHGADELKVTSLEAVILGNINEDLVPLIDADASFIDDANRIVNVSLLKPFANDQFFTEETFTPIWKINGKKVDNETQLYFPSQSTTRFRFGDSISVSYKFQINGLNSVTADLIVGSIVFDRNASQFSLSPVTVEVNNDISLNTDDFTENELEIIEARWRINGILIDSEVNDFIDETIKTLTYPGSKLSYGDKVELLLLPKGAQVDRAFSHIATASVGVNLTSLANNQSDPETDLDNDNDGVPNHLDYFRNDAQCSVLTEGLPDDLDSDGISDLDELKAVNKTNPNLKDTDSDGLSDYDEINIHFTDPTNSDTDGDGYLDGVEIDIDTDPNNIMDPDNTIADNDFDGLSNELELVNNTKVNVFDTDKDGLSDWDELNIRTTDPLYPDTITDPLNADTDGDGLSDGAEVNVTFTNPTLADTDGDGLSDGIEVVLKLNPNDPDTDNNGILDPDEPGFDFNISIPSILFQGDLRDYKNSFSTLLVIEQGTCFRTWLANHKPTSVNYTHEVQSDSNSVQEIAFVSDKWSQIVRFDAQNKVFTGVIDLSDYNAFAASLTYDVDFTNTNLIYIGLSDGTIRRYNKQTKLFEDIFLDTGYKLPVSTLINQGDILISEQVNDAGEILHAVFDLNSPVLSLPVPDPSDPPVLDPSSVTIKDFSYKNSIWSDGSKLELLSFDPNYSQTSFIKETFNTSLNSPVVSFESIDLLSPIESPLFIENINGKSILRFGNGAGYNLSDDAFLQNTISPFRFGLEHQSHRVLSKSNSSFIEFTTLTKLHEDKYWRFNTQLINEDTLAVVPVGHHFLAISYSEPSNSVANDGKVAFQYVVLGDEDGDTLPDWWNNLSQTLTSVEFDNYQLTDAAEIPDLLDGTPNVDDSPTPPLLVDTDGDNICDHWEVTLFGTDPLLADTDSDGMSDSQELGILPSASADCSVYPNFNIISDPLNPDSDSDGLIDGDEAFVYGTDPLNPDTDGDGLTDYQEINDTNTDPNNQYSVTNGTLDGDIDSDGDNLSDSYELNVSNTDINSADSDGDTLTDYDEVLTHGTNPNNPDSDGDGLRDEDEINLYGTDPSSIDTDQDGVPDSVELNLDSTYAYTTDPTVADTDGDGLSDLYEFEYEFEYSEELLAAFLLQNNQIEPLIKSNPNEIDTDGDGICDKWEATLFFTNPAEADTDGDRLSDAQELGIALPSSCDVPPELFPISGPLNRDTDGDGILDGDEVLILETNPQDTDSNDNGIDDGEEDFDSDRLTNYQELYLTKTNPLNADSNGDGITDDLSDEDDDDLTNYDEINLYGTDPLKIDTDGDGINDNVEIIDGLDPIITDTDGDGLSDFEEQNYCKPENPDICLNPNNPDTDGDGLPDDEELISGTDPWNPDSDHDFLLDGADESPLLADRDGDGIPDGIEVHYLRTDPNRRDTDLDNLDDGYETWVYAFEYDRATNTETNTLVKVGEDLDIALNSRAGSAGWPDITQSSGLYKFTHNNLDRVVYDIVDVLDPSLIVGRLYVQRYSNPTSNDSDGDGLFDSTEFEIERVYGVDYNETLDDPSFDPTALNSVNFKVSDPWNIRTVTTGNLDSDGDGLSDLYESKYTLTDPNNEDSDSNGILDGLENKDDDLLNNHQEVLFGSHPNVYDVSLEIYGLDSDGDGLLDIFESKLFDNYDIDSTDSNANGILDGLEDIDGDSLTNIEEMKFQTDPLIKDTGLDSDGDGLTDFQEIFATFTDPNNEDSDANGTLDGQEDPDNDLIDNFTELQLGSDPLTFTDINNILDSDNDGLTDYQEITFTKTDPLDADTDGDGTNDALEDLDSDGLTNFQEMKLGTNPLVSDSDQLRTDSDGDGLVDLYEIKITNTDPLLADSNSDGVLDGQSDLDNDGLTAFVELLFGTDPLVKNKAIDSDNDGLTDAQEILLTLTDPNLLDTDGNSISDANEDPDNDGITNIIEVTVFTDPYSFDLTDAQSDADNDLYTNLLEQSNSETFVTNPDTDNDSLPDGLEVLILGTSASQADTDSDGLNDQVEVKSWSRREVTSSEFCTDTEIRLSSVAGKDYCFSIEYSSYPTLVDSDNDGVADRRVDIADNSVILDHYPLDASCHLSTDGFITNDQSIQCFSSWMAEVESIGIIKQAQWEDTSGANTISHADVLFYNTGWDSIIVHNALSRTYESPISIKEEINSVAVSLVDFEFNEADKQLYLLYSDSSLEAYNVQTKVVQTLGNYLIAGSLSRTLKLVNSNKLIIESGNTLSQFSYTLLDSSGASLAVLEDKGLDLNDSVVVCFNINADCDESASIYGFIKGSAGINTNIGRLDINTVTNTFTTDIEISSPLAVDEVLQGPIKASQSSDFIQLGSGQIFNLSLGDTGDTLTREHNNKAYSSYYDFVEYADHFVGVVDVGLTGIPGGEDLSQTRNGLLVTELESIKDTLEQKLPPGDSINDLKVLNQYLLPPERLEEQVVKLIPFAKTSASELAVIKKSKNRIVIDPLGLFDEDDDLMTGLYERVFGLDDTDVGDKFLDLDNDGLSNIEEYFFATDPSKEDTDGDVWLDIDEILNGTDPNNKLSF